MNIQNLETQYLKAKVAYYEGNPIMSDAAFDVLEKEVKEAGSKVIEQVGTKRKDFDFPHPHPMKSLSKLQTESINGVTNYQEEAFRQWFEKRESQMNKMNYLVDHVHYSPKFDGSAINIIYRGRKLESVLTRGDGLTGKDVTDRFRKHLPSDLLINELMNSENAIIEIRCEAVMRKSVFQKKYAAEFANARNIVAGIIGKDDFSLEKVSDLTLIPVHLLYNGVHCKITYLDEIINYTPILAHCGSGTIRPTTKDYVYMMKYMEDFRETSDFQLDGVVFALPVEVREHLGENKHDPEWSIAIKFVPDEVVTPVIGIEWNLGKTGEFTPVVKLKPVTLAGTEVKRASGYNAGYILKNKLGEGAFVSIAKAGDIIPEIQEVVVAGQVEAFPKTCPHCGSTLTFDGIHLMCENDDCEGKIGGKLSSACGMLDLKGIAGQTIKPFASDFKNMFEIMEVILTPSLEAHLNCEKFGLKRDSRKYEIFVNAFKNIKSLTYAQVILMMGYDGVGKTLSTQVARQYCGLTPNYASLEKALVEKFQNKVIESNIKDAVKTLESLGITIDKPEDKKVVTGTVYVCMTGSPREFGFKTKEEWIKQFPNLVDVDLKDATYLITDDYNSTSSKMKNAAKKGIKIVTYGDFKL